MIRIKLFIIILALCIPLGVPAQVLERPLIWVRPGDRLAILEKIDKEPWANEIYTDFMDGLKEDTRSHQSDPTLFLKGLPFDWDNGKPNQIPPFHPTFHIENGQHKNLDNALKKKWPMPGL